MLKNVQQELNRFAKYVITQSKANLTRGKKNSSKTLYNSLDYDLNVSPNSFSLSFLNGRLWCIPRQGSKWYKKEI